MVNVETLEQIKRLVDDRVVETKYLEFKEEISKKGDTITKGAVAFANADGGEMIIGVKDKNGVAWELAPIAKKGIRERVAQIIESNTEPKLEGFEVILLDDDKDDLKGYIVVRVRKSNKAPHMDTEAQRYYIRRGNRSDPMLDSEVRSLLFRRGMSRNLTSEINSNVGLAEKTIKRVNELLELHETARPPYLFIPLKVEAWRAFQYSGYASVIAPDILDKLVNGYNLVDEVNDIIHFSNIRYSNQIITTPVDGNDVRHGIYVPALISEKMIELRTCFMNLEELLKDL